MDSLRISLIVIGAVIILGLYLWSRIVQKKRHAAQQPVRETPHFESNDVDDWDVIPLNNDKSKEPTVTDDTVVETKVNIEPVALPVTSATTAAVDSPAILDEVTPQKSPIMASEPIIINSNKPENMLDHSDVPAVIALHIISKNEGFLGSDLVKAANLAMMRFGEMGIFHFQGSTKGDITFSMANMLEPGTFDMDNLGAFTTQGVLLFMESEFQKDLSHSLDSMARVVKSICEQIDGQVCDDQRKPFEVIQLDAWKEHILLPLSQL